MAIFDLPIAETRECTFEIDDGTKSSPFNRGQAFNLTQVTDPVWWARIETPILSAAQRQQWSAWKHSLRGGFNRMRAYDTARRSPLAYPAATAPGQISTGWAGTGSASALGAGGALTVSGLPAGYKASVGDRVGIEQGGRYGYYSILAAATANAGGVISLSVAPFLHLEYFSVGATVRLWRPRALFIMDWSSWSLPERVEDTAASFQAYQVLA